MLPLSGYEHCVAPVHHPWTTGQFQDGLYHNGVLVHLQALGVDALMFPQLAPQKLLGQNRKKKVTNGNIITLNSSLFLRCDLSTLVVSFVLLYTHKAVFHGNITPMADLADLSENGGRSALMMRMLDDNMAYLIRLSPRQSEQFDHLSFLLCIHTPQHLPQWHSIRKNVDFGKVLKKRLQGKQIYHYSFFPEDRKYAQ